VWCRSVQAQMAVCRRPHCQSLSAAGADLDTSTTVIRLLIYSRDPAPRALACRSQSGNSPEESTTVELSEPVAARFGLKYLTGGVLMQAHIR
jgi:hypothetical protein